MALCRYVYGIPSWVHVLSYPLTLHYFWIGQENLSPGCYKCLVPQPNETVQIQRDVTQEILRWTSFIMK